jgi:murein DD-endopeptidase MepM/ murein hydrolase activator NlpD
LSVSKKVKINILLGTTFLLPFDCKSEFLLTQGYLDKYTHKNSYSLDFKMPIGTNVLSMKDGIVLDVVDKFEDNILPNAYKENINNANYISIKHNDETISLYYHLKKGSAKVKKGWYIRKGKKIAESGNSGYSTSPHLHIEVVKPFIFTDGISIPVNFKILDKNDKEIEIRGIDMKRGNYFKSSNCK